MTPSRDLSKLATSAIYRFAALRRLLDASFGGVLSEHVSKNIVSTVTVDALNTWTNFSRAFYLSCCVGAYLNNHGFISTTTPFISFNASIGNAISLYRPSASPRASGVWHRRDEPTWHDTGVLLNCCSNVGASNHGLISASLSLGTRVFIDLPVFRNYCGHKNQQTSEAAQALGPNYGIPATLLPFDILRRVPFNSNEPLIKVWLYDLETVVSLLCT